MDDLTRKLGDCYSGVVHDVMRDMGFSDFTLPPEIRPLFPDRKLAGPVFTIAGRVDTGADPHQTLVEWTGLLSKAKSGHIWVCQPNDDQVAHMGELSGETLLKQGVLGVVTDGFIRDVSFLLDMGLECWSRGFTPRDIVGRWLPDGFDVPIVIGDVRINSGDYCLGDRDGMVILPAESAEQIVDNALTAIGTENKVRTAILDGMDPQQAYLEHGKF